MNIACDTARQPGSIGLVSMQLIKGPVWLSYVTFEPHGDTSTILYVYLCHPSFYNTTGLYFSRVMNCRALQIFLQIVIVLAEFLLSKLIFHISIHLWSDEQVPQTIPKSYRMSKQLKRVWQNFPYEDIFWFNVSVRS